ncbi:hypothetical protein VOLCADRAFT_121124 [Volvox carteri f. nagariensis]|uniref:Uncharacterized protein n=1 Tax=Volvox carteri f. nagariensis TaxID=3068 RepID=D8U2R7_VOLCA|nr:uncharacterized protein VOLCADRAFT_121124 [Volvox carteri f. nagariensis]EFJ45946.1 hypothetical protein VOLCADRAFT_121124 [Volvox carteri f. nagariensis]|eukprot:XP_002953024.1 hypothetical protein VOLCADRAFT_121124 [Volvox carteri f. nagariensis]
MLCQAVRSISRATPAGFAGLWNLSDSLQMLGLYKGDAHAEVYAIDPRTVLRPSELEGAQLDKVAALIRVPVESVSKLSKGVSELADMDEPGNAWYFGQRAEIFDYKLVGEFPTKSGFAAFIYREVLEKIRQGEATNKKLPTWEEFLALTSDQVTWPHRKTPFLFAGRMVEASMAALYTLEKDGRVTGVLISSESSGDVE